MPEDTNTLPGLYARLTENQRAVLTTADSAARLAIQRLVATDNGSISESDPDTIYARRLRTACHRLELYLGTADALGLTRMVAGARGYNVPKRVQNARHAYAGSETLDGVAPVETWRQIGQHGPESWSGLDTYFWRLRKLVEDVRATAVLVSVPDAVTKIAA